MRLLSRKAVFPAQCFPVSFLSLLLPVPHGQGFAGTFSWGFNWLKAHQELFYFQVRTIFRQPTTSLQSDTVKHTQNVKGKKTALFFYLPEDIHTQVETVACTLVGWMWEPKELTLIWTPASLHFSISNRGGNAIHYLILPEEKMLSRLVRHLHTTETRKFPRLQNIIKKWLKVLVVPNAVAKGENH